MKKILMIIMMAIVVSTTVSAQFSLAPKAGVNFKKLNFEDDYMTSNLEPGFTFGAMGEVMLGKSGLALDISLMYSKEYFYPQVTGQNDRPNYDFTTDYLNIPVNLKWKISIPAISNVVKPMVYTGPEMSFVLKETIDRDFYQKKTIHFCWNIGAGVELFNKWQIAAHYGIGLTNCLTKVKYQPWMMMDVKAKQQYAVVTIAYLFSLL